MFKTLQKKFSEISAEQVFSLYDARDKGFISKDQFMRIIKIFFEDILEDGDLEFLLRLTVMSADQKIQYRDFCKFLSKRLIRSFKKNGDSKEKDEKPDATASKSWIDSELERPIQKEASLNYILKKAAELQIDLRREFIKKDPLELSVLSRVQFWNIIASQPLGLNDAELNEVFEHDLGYDNYGNVDYTAILNSDLFVLLEARRLQKKAQGARANKLLADKDPEDKKETRAADNRKVVVEDLIFIDDLEMIIYSTVAPKTSTVFITSLKKQKKHDNKDEKYIVELAEVNQIDMDAIQQKAAQAVARNNSKQDQL